MDLKVWWDEDADDATIVRSADELDAVFTQAREAGYAILVELLDAENPRRGLLDVGFNGDHGVLYYAGGDHPDGVFSKLPGTETSAPEQERYYYMSADREFPASAVLPLNAVLSAAHEYMEFDGARPAAVEWQPRAVPTS